MTTTEALQVTQKLALDPRELRETFLHSSGPGGQNVNKVATAVQLRFDIAGSPSLPDDVRRRLLNSGDRRITQDGTLVLTARSYRTLERNRADARARLLEVIRRAATPPRPRRPTRPTASSRQQRLEQKAARGKLKRQRRAPPDA
jgi:ribosome-associated protein